jgi:hypothetical protein
VLLHSRLKPRSCATSGQAEQSILLASAAPAKPSS